MRGTCDCCRYDEIEVVEVRKASLCLICANTEIGMSYFCVDKDTRILRTIGYIGNLLLEEIKKKA
jgi:hypothetical protein